MRWGVRGVRACALGAVRPVTKPSAPTTGGGATATGTASPSSPEPSQRHPCIGASCPRHCTPRRGQQPLYPAALRCVRVGRRSPCPARPAVVPFQPSALDIMPLPGLPPCRDKGLGDCHQFDYLFSSWLGAAGTGTRRPRARQLPASPLGPHPAPHRCGAPPRPGPYQSLIPLKQ